MTSVLKMVVKRVANKAEIRAYIKARYKIVSLKQNFADLFVFTDLLICLMTGLYIETKINSELQSIENAPKLGRPKEASS